LKVAIVGSRCIAEFDRDVIFRHLPKECSDIISGGAPGVDTVAEKLARDLKLNFIKITPDYKTFGKNAPLMRNRQIAEQADLVLAVWDLASRGTAHMIAHCIAVNIPVRVILVYTP